MGRKGHRRIRDRFLDFLDNDILLLLLIVLLVLVLFLILI